MIKSFYYTFYFRDTLHFAIAQPAAKNKGIIVYVLPEEEKLLNEFGTLTLSWYDGYGKILEPKEGISVDQESYQRAILVGFDEYILSHESIFS